LFSISAAYIMYNRTYATHDILVNPDKWDVRDVLFFVDALFIV
jgi:hypothetical protein